MQHEESWALKNWCFWTVVLEKTLESPLDFKEIQPIHSEGDQSWVFFGRNDAEAETPVLWPPHAKSWLIGKDSDAGRDWGQEEKGTTEDEMAGWHHWLDGREFEWTLGVGDGQGGLVCCNLWGRKESDTTERLNWTELKIPWRGKWQPTPVFLPGESHGQRSLVGHRPRGCRESDATERLNTDAGTPHNLCSIKIGLLCFYSCFHDSQFIAIFQCLQFYILFRYKGIYMHKAVLKTPMPVSQDS